MCLNNLQLAPAEMARTGTWSKLAPDQTFRGNSSPLFGGAVVGRDMNLCGVCGEVVLASSVVSRDFFEDAYPKKSLSAVSGVGSRETW